MLSQDDRQRLEEIERRLVADDPRFVARMRSQRPIRLGFVTILRTPWRIGLPTLILAGLWIVAFGVALLVRSTVMTVALLAIVVIEAGWRLYRRRRT